MSLPQQLKKGETFCLTLWMLPASKEFILLYIVQYYRQSRGRNFVSHLLLMFAGSLFKFVDTDHNYIDGFYK
jgi:hypothetical protein